MPPIRFFETVDELHRYSLQLGHSVQGVHCQHCSSTDHWVSHGFVYKKDYGGNRLTVGKRVLCSNRGCKKGCGRTVRLYLAQRTPRMHYAMTAIFMFLQALLSTSINC